METIALLTMTVQLSSPTAAVPATVNVLMVTQETLEHQHAPKKVLYCIMVYVSEQKPISQATRSSGTWVLTTFLKLLYLVLNYYS